MAQMVTAGMYGSGSVTLISSLLQAEVLASGAGDAAVKLWSFSRRRCMATLHGDLLSLEILCCIVFHCKCPRILMVPSPTS